jgi:hypothetical protein
MMEEVDCKKVTKHPFLLLEVLIAILLVSLCLIPLIQSPIIGYKAEIKLLEEMEGERIAEWTFSEIKEKIINQEIPWEALPLKKMEKTNPFPLPPTTLSIPNIQPKQINRFFRLKCIKEKEGENGEIHKMLGIEILFEPRLSQKKENNYLYRITVTQAPNLSQSR